MTFFCCLLSLHFCILDSQMANHHDLGNDDLIMYISICIHHIHMMFIRLLALVLTQKLTPRTSSIGNQINCAIRLRSEQVRDEVMQRIAGQRGRYISTS